MCFRRIFKGAAQMKADKLREIVEAEVFVSTEAADYLGMSRQNLSRLGRVQRNSSRGAAQGRRGQKTGRS